MGTDSSFLLLAHRPRREARQICHEATACRFLDERSGTWKPAGVRDLSSGGICLLLEKRRAVGTALTVELTNRARGLSRRLLAQVRHADICCPNDAYLHGCLFLEPLPKADLQALL
jgi:hypothetical protein